MADLRQPLGRVGRIVIHRRDTDRQVGPDLRAARSEVEDRIQVPLIDAIAPSHRRGGRARPHAKVVGAVSEALLQADILPEVLGDPGAHCAAVDMIGPDTSGDALEETASAKEAEFDQIGPLVALPPPALAKSSGVDEQSEAGSQQ